MNLSTIVNVLIISAIALNVLAAVGAFLKRDRLGVIGFITAWCLNLVVFVLNWAIAGEPPFGNMYHVLIVISLCFLPAYLLLRFRDGLAWLLGCFCIVPTIPLLGTLFMKTDLNWQRMPALQSHWFVPHVAAYVLSYSLNAVGFALSLIYGFLLLASGKNGIKRDYEDAIYKILLTAFPLMTFGMLSGALWAEEAWGRYWSWDVKETWALITWILYLVYFHCRKAAALKKYALIAQGFAFIALLTTFLVVNFSLIPRLKSLLHAY